MTSSSRKDCRKIAQQVIIFVNSGSTETYKRTRGSRRTPSATGCCHSPGVAHHRPFGVTVQVPPRPQETRVRVYTASRRRREHRLSSKRTRLVIPMQRPKVVCLAIAGSAQLPLHRPTTLDSALKKNRSAGQNNEMTPFPN